MNDVFAFTSVLQPNISWCIHNLFEIKEASSLLMLMSHSVCIKVCFILLLVKLSQILAFLAIITGNCL